MMEEWVDSTDIYIYINMFDRDDGRGRRYLFVMNGWFV